MTGVHGTCDSRFETVRVLFAEYLENGEELGASICVNVGGVDVLDLWGGYTDQDHTQPWDQDTITIVWSSTKTVTSLATLMVADRGLLDVDEKVSKYWPQFAANGKQEIKVRNLLSHTSGVGGWEEDITLEKACDREKSTSLIATQAPLWNPGTAAGYHAVTFGPLLGELIRRTTGKVLTEFVAEEIIRPLGADFQIGAQRTDWSRISPVVPPPPLSEAPEVDPTSVAFKVLRLIAKGGAEAGNSEMLRYAELGGSNGYGNARSLVRILSVIALGGEVQGKRLLSQETIDLIFKEQAYGSDLVLGTKIRWGIGYALTGNGDTIVVEFLPPGRICLWGGWGGSLVIMDLDRKLTIAYVMNKMSHAGLGNTAGRAYVKAVYEALT